MKTPRRVTRMGAQFAIYNFCKLVNHPPAKKHSIKYNNHSFYYYFSLIFIFYFSKNCYLEEFKVFIGNKNDFSGFFWPNSHFTKMTLGWSFWKFHPIRTLSPRIENRKFSILERFLIERISGPKIDFWDFLHQNVMNLDFGWFFSKNFDLSRILNFKMKFENFWPCIFLRFLISWILKFRSKKGFFSKSQKF